MANFGGNGAAQMYRENAASVVQKRLNLTFLIVIDWGGHAHWRYVANTVERWCASAKSSLPLGVATRPVPKLF